MKIQAMHDLLNDRLLDLGLSGFNRNDQTASGDILDAVFPGDLVLRDLGYFSFRVFRKMDERGIFFLSRLRDRVALFDMATGKWFDLLGALRRQGRLDIDLLAGLEEKLPVRIVAVPVSDRIANERRRKARGNRDKRYRPAAESQELPGWEIFMTNVPRSVWSTKTASRSFSRPGSPI